MMEKNTNTFTMFLADCTGNAKNSTYRNRVTISTAEDLAAACRKDHVCAEFANYHRSNGDFIRGYAFAADCDNDFTEDPAEWITPATVAEQLPGVAFYAVKSRNCDKVKHPGEPGEKSARPRYHYYFPFRTYVEGYETARKLADIFLTAFPMFDDEGTKPAQFFYGHAEPVAEFHPGEIDITQYFHDHPVTMEPEPDVDIPKEPIDTAVYSDDFATLNVDDMFSYIPAACDYATWYKVGMAIKAAGLPFEVWDNWSRTAPDMYPGIVKTRKKWLSFKGGRVTFGTLVHIAKQNGWTPDPDKLTGEAKRNHERKIYREEQQRKYREAHREEHAAKLAAIGIDCAGDPYRYTWTLNFDGSIDEVTEIATGKIVYHKSEEERAAARAAGNSLRPLNVHQANANAKIPSFADPAAPWDPIIKGKALPRFPLEQFPAWIQEHINNYCAATGINKDYCAAAVLGAISAVTVGHCEIPFNGDHLEPCQLYSVFVGSSGSMKSSVIRHFMAPATEWLRTNNKLTREHNFAVKKEIDELRKQIADLKKEKRPDTEQIREIAARLEQKQEEVHPGYPVPWDDVTPESLLNAMNTSRGTANIATAEGNIINVICGRYAVQRGATPNLDVFLKGADGESIHNFRVTSGEIDIPRADLSMLLALQPGLLERLCSSADASGRGLTQRFLIYAPDETENSIDHATPLYMDPAHAQRWKEHIVTIAARYMSPDEPPKQMPLDPDADIIIRRFWNYENELKAERGPGDEETITSWIGKLHGKALRVAAMLALLRDNCATRITAQDAEIAVYLFKQYYIPHFIGAYEHANNLTKEQRLIVSWLVRNAERTGNRERFTEHDLWVDLRQRAAFAGSHGRDKFNQAMADLQEKNYIRPTAPEKSASGRGRPSKTWQTNPEVYTK